MVRWTSGEDSRRGGFGRSERLQSEGVPAQQSEFYEKLSSLGGRQALIEQISQKLIAARRAVENDQHLKQVDEIEAELRAVRDRYPGR